MIITIAWLKERDACSDMVDLFEQVFGESVEITRETLLKAAETGQAPSWLADELLNDAALAEYQRVTAPALAEYQRVKAQALAEYERVKAPALADALGL